MFFFRLKKNYIQCSVGLTYTTMPLSIAFVVGKRAYSTDRYLSFQKTGRWKESAIFSTGMAPASEINDKGEKSLSNLFDMG